MYSKPNPNKNRTAIYLCFHRWRSTVPLSEIRRHHDISALLQKVNTRLTFHQWKEDDTNIATLGFFVGVDPTNHLQDNLVASVRTHIATTLKRNPQNIPEFKLVFSSPYVMLHEGNRIATKSYDLQVRQQDAKDMVNLLRQAYENDPRFIFHKMRHQNIVTYTNAIRKQNAFLSHSRVVPIQGITEDMMFALELELKQVDGITDVLRHKDTLRSGRWNILTTDDIFRSVTQTVDKLLQDWVPTHQSEYLMDDSFPPFGLAFRNNQQDSDSERSFQTYMSSCSILYCDSPSDNKFDNPPAATIPTSQAWGGVPKVLDATVSTPSSGISPEGYDKLLTENDRLRRELSEMRTMISSIQAQQQSFNMTQLIEAATNAALQVINKQQQPPTSSPVTGSNRPPSTPPPPKRRDTKSTPLSKPTANSSTLDASFNTQND
jgi:hypothetical protein